jgi:hypothetical protein
LQIKSFNPQQKSIWNDFVARHAPESFLLTREYVSYHENIYADRSLLVYDAAGVLIAIFPCADIPNCSGAIASHPGLTYGGLIHGIEAEPDLVVEILQAVCEHFQKAGCSDLVYRSRPIHLRSGWHSLNEYALWRCGAEVVQRDLWNVVSLRDGRRCSSNHRTQVRQALRLGLSVRKLSFDAYPAFYEALVQNLQSRYRLDPVHSLGDLRLLASRFPKQIQLWGMQDPEGIDHAYVWLFKFGARAWHTQYIVGTPAGRRSRAPRALLEHLVSAAEEEGVSSFSFGRSTEADGHKLNAGLFGFKSEIGRGSVVQDIYRLPLGRTSGQKL